MEKVNTSTVFFMIFLQWKNSHHLSPLAQNPPINQALLIVVFGDHQQHLVPNLKIPVRVQGGVETQAGGIIGHGAEHPAAVLAADGGLTAAPQRVADGDANERVGLGLLHGHRKRPRTSVVFLEDTLQLVPRAKPLPQIGAAGVKHIPVTQGQVSAAALQQAPVGSHSQHRFGAEGGVNIIPLLALLFGQVPVQAVELQGEQRGVRLRCSGPDRGGRPPARAYRPQHPPAEARLLIPR